VIDNPGIVLLVVAGLAVALVLLRRQRAAAPDGIRVLGRTALHKGAVVAVIAVGDQRLLIGAGEKGVHLLTELTTTTPDDVDDDASDPPVDTSTTTTFLDDRTDAIDIRTTSDGTDVDAALTALASPRRPSTTAGPGIGLVDRLREMTVRTPHQGRPSRVLLRR